MPSKSNVLGSLLYEGFQTIYEEIMVARGYLAVMLDGDNVSGPSNFARKLMELNHEMDRLLLESEHFLSELQGAAE